MAEIRVPLPDDLHAEMKIKAIKQGITMSAAMRRAVEKYVHALGEK